MASQQKHRELLDFSKPIRMLEFTNVETNTSCPHHLYMVQMFAKRTLANTKLTELLKVKVRTKVHFG